MKSVIIILNNPTITDPSLAPPGHSVLYLLAPMPNLQGNVDWDAAAPVVREKLLRGLERLVDPDIRRHIVWERQYRPSDWERDINAPYGVAFGSLSHGFFQSSYFRPHNVAWDIPGLFRRPRYLSWHRYADGDALRAAVGRAVDEGAADIRP